MTSNASSLVHTKETKGPLSDIPTYRSVRARKHQPELDVVTALYRKIDDSSGGSREESLSKCRKFAWFVRDRETDLVHVASNSCRLRWCPICADSKRWFISQSVSLWAQNKPNLRFMTLTLRHSTEQLSSQIDRLYKAFKLLRNLKQFKSYCKGGIWFFQVKKSSDNLTWHPHLHCLIVGYYIPQIWLSNMWFRSSKCSKVVDIRKVYKPEKVSQYVARYAARPANLKDYTEAERMEIFESFHGRRLCGTWGAGKDCPLSTSKLDLKTKFAFLGNWSTIHELSKTEPLALEILRCWSEQSPIDPSISFADIDLFLDGYEPIDSVDIDIPQINQLEFF